MHLLSILIFLPLAGTVVLMFVSSKNDRLVRIISLFFTLLTAAVALNILGLFSLGVGGFQLIEKHSWIPSIGAYYNIGIDGISLLLVLLTVVLSPICILASVNGVQKSVKGFHIAFLILETTILGVFLSLDALMFYVFWEAMLIPMALLIGIWGSSNRIYAAIKFFLYTMAGSIFLLFGLLFVYYLNYKTTGILSFSITDLYKSNLTAVQSMWLFAAVSIGFAIKVPLWPFHTWLPDAHTEAPTAGSVILAGVLLKMGCYGFLRFSIPMFPEAARTFAPYIIGLSIIGILFGGLVAMVQTDIKRLVAYSSVAHLGFVMLGIFSFTKQGMYGGVLQMVVHGINTGLLFLLVGMIYERRHTREIKDINGLAVSMPLYSTIFAITAFASIGLPGTNGFVGEFLCLLGGFQYNPLFGTLAALGVIIAAMYLLLVNQKVIFGAPHGVNVGLSDLTKREWVVLLPLVIFIFWIGLYPSPFFRLMDSTVFHYFKTFLM